MTMTYLWQHDDFYQDLKQVCMELNVQAIRIASAEVTLSGVKRLQMAIAPLKLGKDAVKIYCSARFNALVPTKVLQALEEFAHVYIIVEPALHGNVYEFKCDTGVVTYSGSVNLTTDSLLNRQEMMVKAESDKGSLDDFWEELWQHCVLPTAEVRAHYEQYPVQVARTEEESHKWHSFFEKLETIYTQQCIESHYPALTGYYFGVRDYSIFNEAYEQSGTLAVRTSRKETQEKFYELHEAIQSHAARLDLHPHYQKEHLTSGIVPSLYNFGRVTGIWMRYGKHKDELQLFGKSYKQSKAPIEQFHKHACLQLAIGERGLSMGMFHSTANDGVDCGHVKDHWPDVQQKIRAVYEQVQGHQFVWTFHSNRENRHIADFDLDSHTAEQFIAFYKRYYLEGYESFCMRFYETDDTRIKTYKDIVREVCATFDAIMPLYEAMTFRVPVGIRGMTK